MTAAFDTQSNQAADQPLPGLLIEWQRIELLCLCFMQAREGPDKALLEQLRQAQHQVTAVRQRSGWQRLKLPESVQADGISLDLLACVFAPKAVPRIGWMYQDLQQSQQPAPSEALILALLAVPDEQLDQARLAMRHLEQLGLLHRSEPDPFCPLQPDPLALSRLMQWSDDDWAPPGAYPVRHRADWDDLVLPPAQKQMLRETLYWIEHRQQVVDHWGGGRCGGPVALFAGPSGTGKTLAASVMARVLGWPLYRVDLAALVSKYVGETEKNLGRLFDATHGRDVILQFDEVDALMGKRGELREAKDRYANMEVSYLLARIEDHDGPCLLTTNLRSQIDKAFLRRFQMVVEFPKPDARLRLELWQRLLPPRAPRAEDLDLERVARAVNLTGGQIRNAALHAAYLAAAGPGAIGMAEVALAILRELAKEQAQVNTTQLTELAIYLPTEGALQ